MNSLMQRIVNWINPYGGRVAPVTERAAPVFGAGDGLSDALAAALSGSSDWSPTHYAGYFAASAPCAGR